jgi:hypothetical protein
MSLETLWKSRTLFSEFLKFATGDKSEVNNNIISKVQKSKTQPSVKQTTHHYNEKSGINISSLIRGVQPKLVSGPQINFFPIIWAAVRQKPKKNGQNTDFSLNSESSLGRTKIFLNRMRPVGRRLDAPVLDIASIN